MKEVVIVLLVAYVLKFILDIIEKTNKYKKEIARLNEIIKIKNREIYFLKKDKKTK